ncbi:MAG: FAD-binding oxidoreductase [Verrucomicrobia bacterium]|nr:FAD-binding oxidoreductase [Verrucomicrobiota bacterium]
MTSTDKLRQVIGEASVSVAEDVLFRSSMDNLRLSRLPDAVVFPRDEEMVGQVLRLANELSVPVTARGAGSATTGATTPWHGGWVLDFSQWQQLHIDPVSQMAYVQPGVTVQALDQAALKHGLTYPPDPGSAKYATIGGTLACNAGGLRGAKYGVTRDYVYALEGFLPTGEFVRWGAGVKKYVSGYNMRDLWIGSEGTLGVITGAVLKLIPAPESRQTFFVRFLLTKSVPCVQLKPFSPSACCPAHWNFSIVSPLYVLNACGNAVCFPDMQVVRFCW